MPDPLTFPIPDSLESERLVLRSFRADDAPVLHEALLESITDLRAHLWFLPWVAEEPTLKSASARCRKAAEDFAHRKDFPYLGFDKATDRLVASVGLHRTDWTIPTTEVGYWVRSSETGKGYASECVAAMSTWALEQLGAARIKLVTDEQNGASRAVAKRCGFVLEGHEVSDIRGPDGEIRNNCIYVRKPSTGRARKI